MRKTILIILISMFLTGCVSERKEQTSMQDIGYTATLEYTGGTGFMWSVVYHSDNLEIADVSSHIDVVYELDDGGSGTTEISCNITTDEDALLIVKLSREGEKQATYQSYLISTSDGKADATVKTYFMNIDQKFAYVKSGTDFISMFVTRGWEYESFTKKGSAGFRLHPENEKGNIELFYSASSVDKTSNGKVLEISGEQYVLKTNWLGKISEIAGSNGVICRFKSADWMQEYFAEIIEMIDSFSIEQLEAD